MCNRGHGCCGCTVLLKALTIERVPETPRALSFTACSAKRWSCWGCSSSSTTTTTTNTTSTSSHRLVNGCNICVRNHFNRYRQKNKNCKSNKNVSPGLRLGSKAPCCLVDDLAAWACCKLLEPKAGAYRFEGLEKSRPKALVPQIHQQGQSMSASSPAGIRSDRQPQCACSDSYCLL